MSLVDTESEPKAGHRLDVGAGREHPRWAGPAVKRDSVGVQRLSVKNQCRGRAPPGCRPRRLSRSSSQGNHTACAAECSRSAESREKRSTWPSGLLRPRSTRLRPIWPRGRWATWPSTTLINRRRPSGGLFGGEEWGTPLSDLDILRPHHLTRASASMDRLRVSVSATAMGTWETLSSGNDGRDDRIIDYEQAVRNASCARDGAPTKFS